MVRKARVVTRRGKKTPNGIESIQEVFLLKEDGTLGNQVGVSVIYWPWSDKSCESADMIISRILRDNDLETEEFPPPPY